MGFVKESHFFRRVPADVSVATSSGGIISIIAAVTISWLVVAQYNESFSDKRVSQLRLDSPTGRLLSPDFARYGGGQQLRINFNITMHHLPCEYAQFFAADHVGTHKLGGSRNVHKLRLSRDGESLGMFEPHKYKASERGKDFAGHVFPWHKKEHTQGDATHRTQQAKKHLSAEQQHVVAKAETAIHSAGKGAHVGRRLLAIEEPPQRQPAAAVPAPRPVPKPDTVPSCPQWAHAGECAGNSAYMLSACEAACSKLATPDVCAKWAAGGRCADHADFMSKFCVGACAGGAAAAGGAAPPPKAMADAAHEQRAQPLMVEGDAPLKKEPLKPFDPNDEAHHGQQHGGGAEGGREEEGGTFTPSAPYAEGPYAGDVAAFEKLVHDNAVVMVNFYAPWCFWSNKLAPAWTGVGKRLHARAYSQSTKFVKIDCTQPNGQQLCRSQSVHAFPSVRTYRGSVRAFEPYEFGREENIIWLHLVKVAAEVLVSEMNDAPQSTRNAYAQQIAHVSADLRVVMDRRQEGLDEDWSEDALSAEDEVAADGASSMPHVHACACASIRPVHVHGHGMHRWPRTATCSTRSRRPSRRSPAPRASRTPSCSSTRRAAARSRACTSSRPRRTSSTSARRTSCSGCSPAAS